MQLFLKNEQVVDNKYPIRYVLKKKRGAEWLIVVFSAFAPVGHSIQHPYHFTNVLDDVPAHRLYIQDSLGRHGTYYLCEHLDFGVEECVSDLIRQIQKQLSCGNDRTICLGSSKGGSAAAYFALKHGISHSIAMVPQMRIGSYIRRIKNTMEDMLGDEQTEQNISMLDSLIFELAKRNIGTKLHILTSEHDEQYATQIAPFLQMMHEVGIEDRHEVVMENNIMSHSDAARFNSEFAHIKLCECMFGARFVQDGENLLLSRDEESMLAGMPDIEIEYRYETSRGDFCRCILGKGIQKIPVKTIRYGEIRVKCGRKEAYSQIYCPWIVNAVSAVCKETEHDWVVSFKTENECASVFKHAFYIFDENNQRIHVEKYTDQCDFTVPILGRTIEKVQCFWTYKDMQFFKMGEIHQNISPIDVGAISYDIRIENEELKFSLLELPQKYKAQFAYYVKMDGKTIFKQNYSGQTSFSYRPEKEGRYSIAFFVRQAEKRECRESGEVLFVQRKADAYCGTISRD